MGRLARDGRCRLRPFLSSRPARLQPPNDPAAWRSVRLPDVRTREAGRNIPDTPKLQMRWYRLRYALPDGKWPTSVAHTYVEIRVEEDGDGFDLENAQRGRGLKSQQRRAQRLGGHLRVESSPGNGTRLSLRLPVMRAGLPKDSAK